MNESKLTRECELALTSYNKELYMGSMIVRAEIRRARRVCYVNLGNDRAIIHRSDRRRAKLNLRKALPDEDYDMWVASKFEARDYY